MATPPLETLRRALEPFAKMATEIEQASAQYTGPLSDPCNWAKSCDWQDLLNARTALDAAIAAPVGTAAALRAALLEIADDLDYTAAHFRDDEVRTMLEGMAADVRAALDAAGEAGGGWRDIATAPKDGTRFLWCADNGEHTKCRWSYSVVRWPEYAECFTVGYWKPLDAPPLPTPPAEGGRDE